MYIQSGTVPYNLQSIYDFYILKMRFYAMEELKESTYDSLENVQKKVLVQMMENFMCLFLQSRVESNKNNGRTHNDASSQPSSVTRNVDCMLDRLLNSHRTKLDRMLNSVVMTLRTSTFANLGDCCYLRSLQTLFQSRGKPTPSGFVSPFLSAHRHGQFFLESNHHLHLTPLQYTHGEDEPNTNLPFWGLEIISGVKPCVLRWKAKSPWHDLCEKISTICDQLDTLLNILIQYSIIVTDNVTYNEDEESIKCTDVNLHNNTNFQQYSYLHLDEDGHQKYGVKPTLFLSNVDCTDDNDDNNSLSLSLRLMGLYKDIDSAFAHVVSNC